MRATPPLEVEVDSRGRVPLRRVATSRRYRVTRSDDGEITLTPVVSVLERELALLSNPEMAARLRRSIAEAEAGQLKPYHPGASDDVDD
jgi:hypothetical protein